MRNWLFSYSVPTNNDKLNLRKSPWRPNKTNKKRRWNIENEENGTFGGLNFSCLRPGPQEKADGSLFERLKRI